MERMDRLNQLFKREISQMILLGEIHDPRVHFVTITFADVSKDLSVAHIGFSVLSDNPDMIKGVQEGLRSASGHVRRLIGERVSIRHIPEIKFVYDATIATSVRMTKTLEEIRKERESHDVGGKGPEGQNPEEKDAEGKG